jgi:hypothetical protein
MKLPTPALAFAANTANGARRPEPHSLPPVLPSRRGAGPATDFAVVCSPFVGARCGSPPDAADAVSPTYRQVAPPFSWRGTVSPAERDDSQARDIASPRRTGSRPRTRSRSGQFSKRNVSNSAPSVSCCAGCRSRRVGHQLLTRRSSALVSRRDLRSSSLAEELVVVKGFEKRSSGGRGARCHGKKSERFQPGQRDIFLRHEAREAISWFRRYAGASAPKRTRG